ncbi:MAG: exodeoxyribonuclease III [Paludibacteraceae bacterium]|jgi:exodeoxyribonuclease-3|nr:exodeoxyribonuclease III [Paludibacteraceae bacterium]
MRIISYNVNGIRAALGKGLADWLKDEQPDVFCLQETKAQNEQLNLPLFEQLGYQGYFVSAQKKGYSGVGILCKQTPDYVGYGMGNELYDSEGRVIRADFGDVTVVCVYIPSGTTGDVRQAFKMDFLADFEQFIRQLRKERPNVIVCGDYNIAHTPIDINHPERQVGVSGFLPEEREWLTHFIEGGMIDSFRVFDSRAEQYSWWTYRMGARKRNAGWRIDYHLVSEPLRNRLIGAGIMQEVVHSDHCPVWVEIKE